MTCSSKRNSSDTLNDGLSEEARELLGTSSVVVVASVVVLVVVLVVVDELALASSRRSLCFLSPFACCCCCCFILRDLRSDLTGDATTGAGEADDEEELGRRFLGRELVFEKV